MMKWLINIAALFMAFLLVESHTVCSVLTKNVPHKTCLFVSKEKLSWMNAFNYCIRNSMNLAELATEREYYSAIKQIKERGKYDSYWIGLNDLGEEGNFTYVGSGRPMQYRSDPIAINNWNGTEHCMELRVWANATYMNDDGCWKEHRFICEKYTRYTISAKKKVAEKMDTQKINITVVPQ